MLRLEQINFGYDHAIINDYSLALTAGQSVALMGPSGCGKSSLLHLMAGFQQPWSGSIIYAEQPIHALQPWQRPLSILFQQNNLFSHLSVLDNIAVGLNAGKAINASQRQRILATLQRLKLDDLATRKPGALSGGQQQRIALVRCLLREQPILLLDEPFTGLDRQSHDVMLNLLKEHQQAQQTIIVMATHQPQDAIDLGAEIIKLD